MHNKTRKRQKFTGGNILPPEIYEILESLGIKSNQTNITTQQTKNIIEKMKENPDLLPFIEKNPALKGLLNTSGGTRHKKIRKQKGGVKLAFLLAALAYPVLGATHSPGNTPQFKEMRALTAVARARAAAKQALRNAKKKGKNMLLTPKNPYLYVGEDPPPFNYSKYYLNYKPPNTTFIPLPQLLYPLTQIKIPPMMAHNNLLWLLILIMQ